ncbi:MAG: exopolyphosphatase [Magnetococcales bacterium]|nr:exopolyphosphatase [Magnetococcales bacterium]
MKLAAIDIGSSSSKLLISNVYDVGDWQPAIKKANLYRVPLRLGEDAFVSKRISPEKIKDLEKTLLAFRNLMDVCKVESHMACATSALRNADNAPQIIKDIKRRTGIDLQLLDGAEVAQLLGLNRMDRRFHACACLYIDVGGGSTDLALLANGQLVAAESFPIGIVRIQNGGIADEEWAAMKAWIRRNTVGYRPLSGVGAGGNINKIFKLTRKRQDKPLSFEKLREIHSALEFLTYDERMVRLGLRPDRADVIVPAGQLFLSVMKWAGISKLYVPQVGLGDGMIQYLYRTLNEKQNQTQSAETEDTVDKKEDS